MAKAKFYLKRPAKDGSMLIMLLISHSCERKAYSTGITVKQTDLAKKGIRFKPQHPGSVEINNRLDEIIEKVNAINRGYVLQRKQFTLNELCAEFELWFQPGRKSVNYSDWGTAFDAWIKYQEVDRKLAPGTVRAKKTLRHALYDFNNFNNVFSTEWLDQFLAHMIDVKRFDPVTTKKRIVHLKEFIKWSVVHKYSLNQSVLTWEPKREVKKVVKMKIYVLPEEYHKIRDAKLTGQDRLQVYRDIAIILYNIGQHFVDADINPDDVYEDMINKFRQKTQHRIVVPITGDLKKVLEKHNYKPPRFSLDKTNQGLKDLFDHLGLNRVVRVESAPGGKMKYVNKRLAEVITTKIMGRNSTATNLANARVHPEFIAGVLGHSNVRQQSDYIALNSEAIEQLKKGISGE